MHPGRGHFNVLAISQEAAKKTFRNGTATNITSTNEKDAFHKMRPREPCTAAKYVRTKLRQRDSGLSDLFMRQSWKKVRYRLEHIGLLIAASLVPLLPRSFLVGLAKISGAVAAVVDRYGRRIALANLDCAFGQKYSASEKRRIIRESYQHFAQTMLDLMWSPRLTPENFSRYIEFEGFPEADPNQNGIVVCYHYSNFEWLSLGCGFRGRPSTIIAQEFKNELLDPIFRRWRERSGHVFSARTRGILRLFKTLRRGGNIAMLVDLTVFPGPAAVAIRCFGLHTSVTSAHAWLHQRSGAALIPAHCEPLPRGRYRVVFHSPIDFGPNATPREIAQACWDSFEPIVRAKPGPWLWMYKHWRYRPKNPERDYPFYSGLSGKFERMTAQK
jgi:Kdo2-lipid IVA lauroyltransferase/acyltransferase